MRKAPSKKGERLLATYIIPGKATNSFCCAETSLTSLGMTLASPSAQADKQVLFRRGSSGHHGLIHLADLLRGALPGVPPQQFIAPPDQRLPQYAFGKNLDRKSTRLNSSHVAISYAVICSKKRK